MSSDPKNGDIHVFRGFFKNWLEDHWKNWHKYILSSKENDYIILIVT